jgi:hypothetical protein
MNRMNDRPDWLERAITAHSATPSARRQEEPTGVAAGDVVVVSAMDFEVADRLVVAVEVDSERRCFLAALATNELPLAGADDVILHPQDTELPYRIAALTRLAGHLWFVQANRRVGTLTENAAAAVRAGHAASENALQRSRRGVPLQDPGHDMRWATLEAEANHMRTLASDCTAKRDGPGIGRPFVDPEFLTATRPETAIGPERFEWLRDHTRGFSPSCARWAAEHLSNQRLRAYGPLFDTTSRPAPPPAHPATPSGALRPAGGCDDELLRGTVEDGLQDAPFVRVASATTGGAVLRPFEDRRAEIVYVAA